VTKNAASTGEHIEWLYIYECTCAAKHPDVLEPLLWEKADPERMACPSCGNIPKMRSA
jgi:hypothetical protein